MRVFVCLSVCLPVARLLSQEGRGLGMGAKGVTQGLNLASLVSSALADGFFTTVLPGKSILSRKSGNLKLLEGKYSYGSLSFSGFTCIIHEPVVGRR